MEGKILFIVFAAQIFIVDSAITDYSSLVPDHYEYSEKFSCVKKHDVFLDRGVFSTYSSEFLGSWPGNNNFDCSSIVYSKTRNTGVVAVIQKLKFRKVAEACKDFVRFQEDTTDRCSDIVFGLKLSKSGKLPPSPDFISVFPGLFDRTSGLYMESIPGVHGSVDSRKRFVSPGAVVTPFYTVQTILHVHSQPALEYEEDLQFMMAYTAYQDCEYTNLTGQMFNCGYGVCILNIFVNDGVVNCPFGDCRDEGGCENAIRTSHLITGEWNVTEAPTAKVSVGHPGVKQGEREVSMAVNRPASVPIPYSFPARDDVRAIGEELRKHNDILARISSVLERGVEAMEGGGKKAGKGE